MLYAIMNAGVIVGRREIDNWDRYPDHKKDARDEKGDGGPVLRPMFFKGEGTVERIKTSLTRVDVTLTRPDPTIDNVREECQRRIMKIIGTPGDLTRCILKQMNAHMRATELNYKLATTGELDSDEKAEAAELQALAGAIKKLRTCSNAIEANPPANFTEDKYWK